MPKISEYPSATSVAGTEVLPIVQSSTTKKVEISKLKGYRSFVGYFRWDTVNEEIDLGTLQNDGFNLIPTRISAGTFNLEDTSAPFELFKTFVMINQDNNLGGGGEYNYVMNTISREDDSNIIIRVLDIDLSGNDVYNTDRITYCSFEIRVYP